jgi:CBS domain-containing protein
LRARFWRRFAAQFVLAPPGLEIARTPHEDNMESVEILVSELMSSPVVALAADARVAEVLALANAHDIHHFPIVEEDRLVGLVCICNLQDAPPESHALSRAWRHVITAPPESSASDAARLMMLHGVGSIVIADHDGLWGILTREDLAQASPELDSLLYNARCVVCGTLRHIRPGAEGTSVCQRCENEAAKSG